MKKTLLIFLILCFPYILALGKESRLMRFPGIGPHQIVFTYAGDLYTVPLDGGLARKLTSHTGIEMFARFSPDGSMLAFTGQYDGNTEVYVMPANGGIPRRVTYTATLTRDDVADRMGPNNIVMGWSPDGKYIIYRSRKQSFNSFKGQLFKVPVEGGISEQLPFPEGGFSSFSPDGTKIAYNRVFREFRTWKYYRGGMADEIWIHDFTNHKTRPVTHNKAQDIIPMWIGQKLYFVSDRDRRMNLFSYDLESDKIEKHTAFTDFDIKFPSHYGGNIVFEKGGYLFRYNTQNGQTMKVPVTIENDMVNSRNELKDASKKIFSAALSPGGERVLFSARGELFSLASEKGITLNMTRSPKAHDRQGEWSPDGKYVAWLSDQTGEYEIWLQPANGEGSPRQLTKGGNTYKFGIAWSPDSRYIAWNDQQYRLMVTEISSGDTRELASSKYSHLGDFSWSPDSKWLTFSDGHANQMNSVYLLNLESGKRYEVTQSWHNSHSPVFSADGKYLLFVSERDFNPIYSNTEWNHSYINTYRIYMTLLSKATPSPFALTNTEVQAVDTAEQETKKEGTNGKKTQKKEKGKSAIQIDLNGIGDRIVSLPIEPAYYYHLNCVEGNLYYNRIFQGGKKGEGLMMYNLKKQKETFLGNYKYDLSANHKKMLAGKNKQWAVIDLPHGPIKMDTPLDLSHMKVIVDYGAEWQQIFDEAWRQMRDFFYVKNMHGVDWQAIHEKYGQLVKHVHHRTDLGYVIGGMIGELNTGHSYINTGEQPVAKRVKTGLLGAELKRHSSGYFQITRILKGAPWRESLSSPLSLPGLNVTKGQYIIAVDKIPTNSTHDFYSLMRGKAGQAVELQINSRPTSDGSRTIIIRPIDDESALYYYTWVSQNREKVARATNGEVGYLHIPDMGPEGLNQFVEYFYPQLDKKALIIDNRGNGGGNVSPMILERLSRKAYRANMRRNSTAVSPIPSQTLVGPMVTLIDKYSASDGDLFSHGFRALGLGKLIGTRTWGGIVGITGSLPFVDGTSLRIPQFTSLSMQGNWMIEGIGVTPDIVIENDPYQEFMGNDAQLNKAIEIILEEMKERKPLPEIPEPPVK